MVARMPGVLTHAYIRAARAPHGGTPHDRTAYHNPRLDLAVCNHGCLSLLAPRHYPAQRDARLTGHTPRGPRVCGRDTTRPPGRNHQPLPGGTPHGTYYPRRP